MKMVTGMSNLNADFVIKRKRKRHPVDPCLGFYSSDYSPPHVEVATYFPGVDEQQTDASVTFLLNGRTSIQPYSPPSNLCVPPKSNLTPAAPNLVDVPSSDSLKNVSSPSSDLVQVPVEEFLKRIIRPKPLKKYGRQRRRIVETSSSSPAQDDDDFSPAPRRLKRRRTASTNHRHASLSPGPSSPDTSGKDLPSRFRKAAKTKVKSLAERLFQASVMSHGNPADCLINPDILDSGVSSSRLPLQFVAETSGLPETKRRTWAMIDPRKAVPFRSASFLSHTSIRDSEVVSFKPLTRWRDAAQVDTLGSPRKRRKIPALATKIPVKPLRCPPLSFIPVQKAEQTYSLRLPRSNRPFSTTLQLPSSVLDSEVIWTPLDFVTPSAMDNAQVISMHYSSPSARSFLESVSPLLPTCTVSPQCTEQLINHACTLDTSESNAVDTSSGFPQSSCSPFPCLPNKPLKPLASFFENFLERGRHVEQIQPSTIPRSTRPEFKSIS